MRPSERFFVDLAPDEALPTVHPARSKVLTLRWRVHGACSPPRRRRPRRPPVDALGQALAYARERSKARMLAAVLSGLRPPRSSLPGGTTTPRLLCWTRRANCTSAWVRRSRLERLAALRPSGDIRGREPVGRFPGDASGLALPVAGAPTPNWSRAALLVIDLQNYRLQPGGRHPARMIPRAAPGDRRLLPATHDRNRDPHRPPPARRRFAPRADPSSSRATARCSPTGAT